MHHQNQRIQASWRGRTRERFDRNQEISQLNGKQERCGSRKWEPRSLLLSQTSFFFSNWTRDGKVFTAVWNASWKGKGLLWGLGEGWYNATCPLWHVHLSWYYNGHVTVAYLIKGMVSRIWSWLHITQDSFRIGGIVDMSSNSTNLAAKERREKNVIWCRTHTNPFIYLFYLFLA